MGKKQLIINLFANLLAFGVQFGINFFLTPYIINSLGSEAYGFIPLSTNVVGITNIITVAFYSMVGRYIAVEVNRNDMDRASVYFTSSTIANLLLTLILLIPSVLITLCADKLINIPDELVFDVQLVFAFSFINMFISLVLSAYGAVFVAANRLDLSARKNIEGNILRAILLIGLFSLFAPKVYFLNATMVVVTAYLVLTNVRYTHQLLPDMKFALKNFRLDAVKEMVSVGVWNSFSQAGTMLFSSLDLLLANLLVGSVVAGEYSVSKTIPNFIQSIITMLVAVFVPQFTMYYARKEKDKMMESISFSIRVMGFLCAVPIGFLLVFGQQFFSLWVPTQDANLLHGLSVVTLLGLVLTCSTSVLGDVFTVTAKLKVPSIVQLILGVINIVVVILLIKITPLGIWAIPLSSLIVAALRGLVFMPIYAAICLNVKYKLFYLPILQSLVCVLLMILVSEIYRLIFPATSWSLLTLAGVICAGIACCINIFIVLNREDRRRLSVTLLSRIHR